METTPTQLDRVRENAPMTPKMAADYLGVTVEGLGKLIAADEDFPVHRLGSGPKAHRRFYRSDLDLWLKSRCSTPIAGEAS